MSENIPTPPDHAFRNRKTRLVAFGVVQICFGGLLTLVALLTMFLMAMMSNMSPEVSRSIDIRMMFFVTLLYGGLAAWFITMGVGSFRTRRWARALVLVSSWIWLFVGVNAIITMAFTLPQMLTAMGSDGNMPPGFAGPFAIVMILGMAVLYLIIPAALIAAYYGKDVKNTCEYYNLQPAWTDRRPLPIIALCFMYLAWVLMTPMAGLYGWMFPFFGVLLTGAKGAVGHLFLVTSAIYFLWGTWHLRTSAWYAAVALGVLWGVSSAITVSTVNFTDIYAHMNLPEQTMEIMRRVDMGRSWYYMTLISLGYFTLGGLGFIIYTKRFYPRDEVQSDLA